MVELLPTVSRKLPLYKDSKFQLQLVVLLRLQDTLNFPPRDHKFKLPSLQQVTSITTRLPSRALTTLNVPRPSSSHPNLMPIVMSSSTLEVAVWAKTKNLPRTSRKS
jgi:hypothetical protein